MDNLGWKGLLKTGEFGKSIVQKGVSQRERVYECRFLSVGFRLYIWHDTSPTIDDFQLLWQILKTNLKLSSMNNSVECIPKITHHLALF